MTLEQSQYSGGRDAHIETVELTDGTTTLRYVLCDIDLTLGGQLYTSLPMDPDSFAPPSQDADGAQEISITIDNVDGNISAFAYKINRQQLQGSVTRRTFLESDLSVPVSEYTMSINSATFSIAEATFVCGYMNLLDYAYPRKTYNLVDFPLIRYL